MLYILSSGLIKLSILFLYRRIFQHLRILILLSIALITLISIAFIFAAIFQCRPTGVLWANHDGSKNSCISILVFWCDVAVIFLVSNVWIVVLPIKPIIGMSVLSCANTIESLTLIAFLHRPSPCPEEKDGYFGAFMFSWAIVSL